MTTAPSERLLSRRKQVESKLISLYKEQRCLWAKDDPDYANRACRNISYRKLHKFYQSNIDPLATVVDVKKKLGNIRRAYMRLSNKIEANPNYQPTLWYYHLLSFLDGCDGVEVDIPIEGAEQYEEGKSELEKIQPTEYKDALSKFIELYKSHRCLWDRNYDKDLKIEEANFAYLTLLNFYRQKINRQASLNQVKKKIENLRMHYRMMKKEAEIAKKEGNPTSTNPLLDQMSFIDGSNLGGTTDDNDDSAGDDSDDSAEIHTGDVAGASHATRKRARVNFEPHEYRACYCDSTVHREGECGLMDENPPADLLSAPLNERIIHSEPSVPPRGAKRSRQEMTDTRRLILDALKEITQTPDDDTWIVAGKSLGQRLGLLNTQQRAIALKLMNDALFYGELGKLNENWAVRPPAKFLRTANGVVFKQ